MGFIRSPQQFPKQEGFSYFENSQALLDTLERIRKGNADVLREGIAHHSQACQDGFWPVLAQACPVLLQV